MLSNDEYRRLLGRPDMTDQEVELLRRDLVAVLSRFVDDEFQDEFTEPDGL